MNIIFSPSHSVTVTPLILAVTYRRFFIALIAVVLALSAVVYAAAKQLTAHWLQTRAPIALAIAEEQAREADAARYRMWEENIGVLQKHIASICAGIINLQNRGQFIAEQVGLPGEKFFAAELDGCDSFPAGAQMPQNADEIAALSTDKVSVLQKALHGTVRRYDILSVRSAQARVRFDTIPMKLPLRGRYHKTSGFGYRKDPFTGRRSFHTGYDYAARRGTTVLAGAAGFVTYSGRLGNYGRVIRISHGDSVSTLYAHLYVSDVTVGQYVRRGQIIGKVGNTGRSTGPHLHYELRLNNKPRPIARAIKELRSARNIPDSWKS